MKHFVVCYEHYIDHAFLIFESKKLEQKVNKKTTSVNKINLDLTDQTTLITQTTQNKIKSKKNKNRKIKVKKNEIETTTSNYHSSSTSDQTYSFLRDTTGYLTSMISTSKLTTDWPNITVINTTSNKTETMGSNNNAAATKRANNKLKTTPKLKTTSTTKKVTISWSNFTKTNINNKARTTITNKMVTSIDYKSTITKKLAKNPKKSNNLMNSTFRAIASSAPDTTSKTASMSISTETTTTTIATITTTTATSITTNITTTIVNTILYFSKKYALNSTISLSTVNQPDEFDISSKIDHKNKKVNNIYNLNILFYSVTLIWLTIFIGFIWFLKQKIIDFVILIIKNFIYHIFFNKL